MIQTLRVVTALAIFVNAPAFAQDAYLKGFTANANDLHGMAAVAEGDTAVVGAPNRGANGTGTATVYRSISGGWTMVAELAPPGSADPEQFGQSASIDGDTLVIGAPQEGSLALPNPFSGAAYVWVRSGSNWTLQQKLKSPTPTIAGLFGGSVSIHGNTLVVGAIGESGNEGRAYVFERTGAIWSLTATLSASNADSGDIFGLSVAVAGDDLIVGAPFESSNVTGIGASSTNNSALNAGAAYVYSRNGGAWNPTHFVKASNTDAGDMFGWSVAVSDGTFVVGAPHEQSTATGIDGDQASNGFPGAGAAYTFLGAGGSLSQEAYVKASNTGFADQFGFAVAIDGDRMVISAPTEESAATGINGNQFDNSAPQAGAAYAFKRSGIGWSQTKYLKASNPDPQDTFGLAIGLSGALTIVGAPTEDSIALGVNGNAGDNSGDDVGAAYLYESAGITRFCQANVNASGQAGRIDATGNLSVAANDLRLDAVDLPNNSSAFFLTSMTRGFVMNPAGSAGNLCLGGSIGRFVGPGQVQFSGATGTVSLQLDLGFFPQPNQLVAVQAGECWAFTTWFRDNVGGAPTSNFTDAVEVRFTP